MNSILLSLVVERAEKISASDRFQKRFELIRNPCHNFFVIFPAVVDLGDFTPRKCFIFDWDAEEQSESVRRQRE